MRSFLRICGALCAAMIAFAVPAHAFHDSQLNPQVSMPLAQMMQGAQNQCQTGNQQACMMVPQFQQMGAYLLGVQTSCMHGDQQACTAFNQGAQQVGLIYQQFQGGFGQTPQGPMGQMPQGPMGQMPQGPMGQMPQMPMGQFPQGQMGQMPQAPMGQMPQAPMGQMPQGQIGSPPPLGGNMQQMQQNFEMNNQAYENQQQINDEQFQNFINTLRE